MLNNNRLSLIRSYSSILSSSSNSNSELQWIIEQPQMGDGEYEADNETEELDNEDGSTFTGYHNIHHVQTNEKNSNRSLDVEAGDISSTSSGASDEESEEDNHDEDISCFLNVIMPALNAINDQVPTESIINDHSMMSSIENDTHQQNERDALLTNTASPYKNMIQFLLIAFFYGDELLNSEPRIKKTMYLLELVLELREALGDVLTMPAPDSIINFMQRVKNKISAFATKKHSAVN
ncbi:hypothetical protein G6F56_011755 [Rhizopus delemar]|nr:hypothetical protein G6F56_011755 [Rhizopus delemar]